MGCDFPFQRQDATHPYGSSVSSSASSSTSSVFSVDAASSQTSSASSSGHRGWDSDNDSWTRPHAAAPVRPTGCSAAPEQLPHNGSISRSQVSRWCESQGNLPPLRSIDAPVPAELRQNPRRCSTAANCRAPPALVRQSERTVKFVDSLVDSATQMVEVIWPLSVPSCRNESVSGRGVLPLRTFIQETLRRSRTSYSTLQVALYYLILIKAHVPKIDFTMEQPDDQSVRALQCGRRMFLAALILASKYLQDRNYSARAWSKISGLKVNEINTNEMAFLKAVNWKLHITDPVFERWQAIVLRAAPSSQPPPSPGAPQLHPGMTDWRTLIPILTPELDTFDIVRRNSIQLCIPKQLTPPPAPVAPSPVRESWIQESAPAPRHKATPFCLEPTVDMTPPAPLLSRLGPLPTPQMTPQSTVSNTPAVGVAALGSRRPSMCAAMAQHQSMMSARCTLDQWNPTPRFSGLEAYQFSGRRPSLAASTTSSSSSPDSMISDNSSRSSRASSISSVSSAAWAPNAARLAKLATCRNAGLPYPVQQKEKENAEIVPTIVPGETFSSPDFESFHINDASEPTPVPFQPSDDIVPSKPASEEAAKGRKRCRSSVDMSLQQNVRNLVNPDNIAAETLLTLDPSVLQRTPNVLPDRSVASSFLLQTPGGRTPSSTFDAKALQSPFAVVPEVRRPVQKDLGRKRACCASEVAQVLQSRSGPGMWEGII